MRYVVLLRHGFHDLRTVLTVERLADGGIWCREAMPPHAEVTRRPDVDARIIYSVLGSRLLGPALPSYDGDLDRGATIQLDGDEARYASNHVALQLLAVPRGEEPPHRETVGDRRIDEGEPDLWVVLHRFAGEPPDRVAAVQQPRRWPPPLWLHAKRPFDT